MELDDMKMAWQSLDQRLESFIALNQQELLREKRRQAGTVLRPLVWGQGVQIILGSALALIAAGFWSATSHIPHLFYAGISLNVYGVLLVICGGAMQGLMSHVDYSAPVLNIQKQLTQLRRTYIAASTFLGLIWWLMWIPLTMVVFAWAFGFDIYANAPTNMLAIWVAIGITGLIATFGYMRWASKRPALSDRIERIAAGKTLNDAQKFLEEIAEFEKS